MPANMPPDLMAKVFAKWASLATLVIEDEDPGDLSAKALREVEEAARTRRFTKQCGPILDLFKPFTIPGKLRFPKAPPIIRVGFRL